MGISVNNVCKSYPQPGKGRLEVLRGCTFAAGQGETLAITGQSGSGKSTLLALLAGLDRPDSGSVMIGSDDLTRLDEAELTRFRSRRIGIIFQQFHLMPHLSALENVRLPLEIQRADAPIERAEQMLVQVGLQDRMQHLPNQLSGGECQRVAIARALVVQPDVLLADEPTGNLDERTGALVTDLLFGLVEQLRMTLLLVTHNPALAERCSRSLLLNQGQLT